MDNSWFVYILKCSDGTYYTGISQDLEDRILRHQSGRGAEHTQKRLPVELVYAEKAKNHSHALSREKWLKHRDKGQKEELISGWLKASPEGG
jgi:putative endonuclease